MSHFLFLSLRYLVQPHIRLRKESRSRRSSLILQSGVFFRRRRRGLAGKRRPDDASVFIELHAQREAHLHQYIFDLVERFPAEVLGLQHFVLALFHEFADGLDVGVLQAVVGAHGKFQLFDVVHRLFKVDKDAHVVFDEFGGETDGILRGDGAVGPDFDHQLFVVGHLAETRGFDGVVHFAHRRVDAVHRDVADGQVFVVVAIGGDVTAAVLYAHLDLQFAAFADGGDVDAFIENGEVLVLFDLRGGDRAGLLDVYVNGFRQVGVELDGDLFQVEDDVRGVFDHAGNRGEFVQDALDFDRGDGCAFDGAEQRATQRVSYRGAPAALKRLRGEAAVFFGQRFQLGGQTLWF